MGRKLSEAQLRLLLVLEMGWVIVTPRNKSTAGALIRRGLAQWVSNDTAWPIGVEITDAGRAALDGEA